MLIITPQLPFFLKKASKTKIVKTRQSKNLNQIESDKNQTETVLNMKLFPSLILAFI
jgi:hypothetical protein